MTMIQRKFYLPEDLYTQLTTHAKVSGKTITQALRELVDEGLQRKKNARHARGAQALLELARLAKKHAWRGPKDLSTKHDTYFAKSHA